jgi:ABC-type branched-subunit amino acid transport system substrate-binding protein
MGQDETRKQDMRAGMIPDVVADSDHRDLYEPVRFGFLGAEMGPTLADAYRRIHRMAFDEAYEAGWLNRRIEIVVHDENGLPFGSLRNAVEGFDWLVEQGCIAVAGAYSGDNAIAAAPRAEYHRTPLISWGGTEHMLNAYSFRLGNGDCGGDPTLIAKWLIANGFRKVGVICEMSTLGEEAFKFFRLACTRLGVQITGVETVPPTTPHMQDHLANLRATGCEALAHIGYGMHFALDLFRPALDALDWDPPRMTGTAFMFYVQTGYGPFEGWAGLDQYCPDNPRCEQFGRDHEARYGHLPPAWPSAIPLIAYDTARVMAEAFHRAPRPDGEGMREGIERLRFLPSTVGGPRTHIAAGRHDHNLFKGDWLVYARCKGGRFVFDGLCDIAL